MNNQTIIELREQDETATSLDVASWENTLNQPLTIREGDTLSLKGAFIDSVAQNSGRINIEPDNPNAPEGSTERENATIGISFAYYFHEWGTSKGNLDDRAYTPTNQKYASGRDYVLCDKISLGGAELTEVSAIEMINGTFPPAFPLAKNIEDPVRFFFHYLNQAGKEVKLQFSMDEKTLQKATAYTGNGIQGNKTTFIINQQVLDNNPTLIKSGSLKFPFIAVKNGMENGTKTIAPDSSITATAKKGVQFNGADFMKFEFMDFVKVTEEDVANTDGDIFQPRIHDYNFTIQARDYAPDELARELSKQLTRTEQELYIADEFAVVDNPLLTTTRSLQVIGDAVVDNSKLPAGFDPITAGNANTPPTFSRDDGNALAAFVADCDNYLVGTSQFAVEFNENVGSEGIFQITGIHTPILDGDGNELNKCIDLGVVAAADNQRVKFIANKNGGILLTDVRPRSLWEDKMKFDTSKLLTTFTMENRGALGGLNNIRTASFNLVDGENSTGQLKSIDVPVNKNTNFDLVQAFTAGGLDVKSPLKMIIDAQDALDGDTALDNGYYLIELTSNFFTEKVGGNQTKKNIMGIVSRFYQQDSFTSAIDGEGTFIYEHKGEPIQISKIGCRILDADHNLAGNLKDNNTIFLQLNRAGVQ